MTPPIVPFGKLYKHAPMSVVRTRVRKLIGWKYSGEMLAASKAIGCKYWSLTRFLSEERDPAVMLLAQIAQHFGMTVDELMAPDTPRRRKIK